MPFFNSLFGPNISKLQANGAVDELIKVLSDQRKKVSLRIDAAIALSELAAPQAIQPLFDVLKEKNVELSEAAIKALSKIGDPAASRLVELLEDRAYRHLTAETLVKMGPQVVGPLVAYLGDSSKDASVTSAFAEVGLPAMDLLIACMLSDENERTLDTTIKAAKQIDSSMTVLRLTDALKDEDVSRQIVAANALGVLADNRSSDSLANLLGNKNEDLRWAAAKSLGKNGDERAIEPLMQFVRSDPSKTDEVRLVLDSMSSDAAILAQLELFQLSDSDDIRREIAASLLSPYQFAWVRDLTSIEEFESLLLTATSSTECNDEQIIYLLTDLGTLRTFERLLYFLRYSKEKNNNCGDMAEEAFVQLGKPALPTLLEFLVDTVPLDQQAQTHGRKRILSILSEIGDETCVQTIKEIQESDDLVQEDAIMTLLAIEKRTGYLLEHKGFSIWIRHSEEYDMWTWDVNVNGNLGAGPANSREQAESDAMAYVNTFTAPGGPKFDALGKPIILREDNVITYSQSSETELLGRSPLVNDLTSMDVSIRAKALTTALEMNNQEALSAVEKAILDLTQKNYIRFYKPDGLRKINPQEVYDELIKLARNQKFSVDPAHVQSLIPGLAHLQPKMMQELQKIDAKEYAIFQLLGVQMQLSYTVGG